MSANDQHLPVVTLASLYGAGGSVIGPRVAERLGVPFLDRAIPEAVARQAGLPEDAVADVDEQPRTAMERLVAALGRTSTVSGGTGGSAEQLDLLERRLRAHIEEFLARMSVSGGVALGRGGMVVLRDVPWALHVHLGGPREARLKQRMSLAGIGRETAERRLKISDRTRIGYVRHAYGIDGEDPGLYHVMIDSTALDLDTCADLIVTASQVRGDDAAARRPGQAFHLPGHCCQPHHLADRGRHLASDLRRRGSAALADHYHGGVRDHRIRPVPVVLRHLAGNGAARGRKGQPAPDAGDDAAQPAPGLAVRGDPAVP